MAEKKYYGAIDLGAESGRVMLGTLSGGKVRLEEIRRFANGPVEVLGSLRWNLLGLYDEILAGLAEIGRRGIKLSSVSTDSWGVNYVLLRGDEPMVSAPFHYRDSRTDDVPEKAFRKVPQRKIYEETGIQLMSLNTLYQLIDDTKSRPQLLRQSDGFLCIADYFNYLLSGVRRQEESLASTTQIYDVRKKKWSDFLLRKFGLPGGIFPKVVPPATSIGKLLPAVSKATGLKGVRVVAGCSHDTAAAVAAVPAHSEDWAYLSSGTWSLLGVELARPIVTDGTFALNFTNELGMGRKARLLKNLVGLFVLQECRREWEKKGRKVDYAGLVAQAKKAPAWRSLIDPGHPSFGKPGGMPGKIDAFCRKTKQSRPRNVGEIVRCILESLALAYRDGIDDVEKATGRRPKVLHIVGGGSRNDLLNQLAADAVGCEVQAGPVECTALGNVLSQAVALRHLPVSKVRDVVRASERPRKFRPAKGLDLAPVLEKYAKIKA